MLLLSLLLACTGALGADSDTDGREDIDPDCPTEVVSIAGTLQDSQTGDPMPGATLRVYQGGTAVADGEVVTGADGAWAWDAPVCDALRVILEADPAGSYPRGIWPHVIGAEARLAAFSDVTFAIIPSLLGVSPDPAAGMIFGTVHDESGALLAGATVVVVDADGVPVGRIYYFVDEFPNRDQPTTSDDGLFIALNVPVGPFDLVGRVDGEQVAEGGGEAYASAVTYSDVTFGGFAWPDECVGACRD